MKNIYKIILLLFALAISAVITSCGDNGLVSSEAEYNPKIVIEAMIYPGQSINNIYISRNYPLNQDLDINELYLLDAQVTITDLENSASFTLAPNYREHSFEYNDTDLQIGYGKSYRLDITAVIDGKTLMASSVTTTPKKGFEIIEEESLAGAMKYREKNESGEVKQFEIAFMPAEGASFYAFSIIPENAKIENFIFDNPYFEIDTADLADDFLSYSQQYNWIMNLNTSSIYKYDLSWLDLWFYGPYRIIVYAGDRNYHHFIATYENVQEMDGNFHEPKFYIDGDGIGYFGSAITDTISVEVTR
jgi:hypothetical protein